MPTLKELQNEYNNSIQKDSYLQKPPSSGDINIGYGTPLIDNVEWSNKDIGQGFGEEVENRRSRNQGFLETLGIAATRLAGKTATKTAQGAGFIGGLLGIDNHREDYKDAGVGFDFASWIAGAADNGLAVVASDLERKLEDVTPLYNSLEDRAANKASIFHNLADGDFWAGDAVDAGAFLLSAYLTGAATAELKVGENLALGLARQGLTKGRNLAKLAATTNVITATALNTASEAMFEARDVKNNIKKQLAEEKYGMSFDELAPEQQLEINKVAGKAAAGTFTLNAAALAIPNFFEMGSLMKNAGRLSTGVKGLAAKGLNTVQAEAGAGILEGVPYLGKGVKGFNKFASTRAGSMLRSAAVGVAREGLWEENVQLAISNMFENDPNASWTDIDQIAGGMINNLGTTEGKKSILLGSLIGGLANTRSGYIDYNRNAKKQKEAIVGSMLANANLSKANNLYQTEEYTETDAEGKTITKTRFKLNEDGNPIVDQDKVAALAANKDQLEYLDDIAKVGEENGDDVLANLAKSKTLSDWVKSHYNSGTEDLIEEKISFLENLSDKDYLEQGFDPSKKDQFIAELKAKTAEYTKMAADIDANLVTKDTSKEGSESFLKRKNELYNLGTTLSTIRSEENRLAIEKTELEATEESKALNGKRLAYIDLKLTELTEAKNKFSEEFKKIADPVKGENYFKNQYKESVTKKANDIVPETVTLDQFNAFEQSRMFGEKLNLKGQNIENEFFEKGVEDRIVNDQEDPANIITELAADNITVSNKTKDLLTEEIDKKENSLADLAQTINEIIMGEDITTTDSNVVAQAQELLNTDTNQEYIADEINKIEKAREELNSLNTADKTEVTNQTIKEKLLSPLTNMIKGNLFNFESSEEYDNLSDLEKQEKALTNMIKVLEEKNDPDYANTIALYKDLLEKTKAAIIVVKERLANKALKQEKIAKNEVTLSLNQLGLNEDGSVGNQELYDFYKSILGNAIDSIVANIKDLSTWGKIGYLNNQLISIKQNMSDAQRKQLETIKENLANKLLQIVKDKTQKGSSQESIRKNYNNNPKYIFGEVIQFLLRRNDQPNNLVVEFIKDYNVFNLKEGIANKKGFDPSMDVDSINEIVNLHQQILAIQNTLDFVDSEQNIVSEVVAENTAANEKDTIIPSNQQLLAIRDLIKFLFTKKQNKGYSNLAYLKGYAGTGKTNIVLKWFTKLSNLKTSEIFATGHNQFSSKSINDSIGTNKERSIDELINGLKSNLPGIKLIVIDEINALSTEKIDEIISLINTYNTNNKTELKLIGLGDPNQITTSQNAIYTPLDSINDKNKDLTLITPLTIRYRSNVQAVVDAQDIFLGKSTNVVKDGIYLTTNPERTLGADGSMSTNGIEESLKTRNLNDGKTRAIIVHPNDVQKWKDKNLGVEVVSYIDVQGRTIDEVFVDIPQTSFADNFMYNQAMYTATSRATNYIYIQGVKSQVNTDTNVNQNNAKNVEDLKQAKTDFLKAREDEMKQLDSDIVLPTVPVTPAPSAEPAVSDENTEEEVLDNEEEDEEEDEEEIKSEAIPTEKPKSNRNKTLKERIKTHPFIEDLYQDQDGWWADLIPGKTWNGVVAIHAEVELTNTEAFRYILNALKDVIDEPKPSPKAHNLKYPTRSSLIGRKDAAEVKDGEPVLYIPIKNSQGFPAIGVYVSRPGGYLQVGVLSQEELEKPEFKKLKEAIKPGKPLTSFVRNAVTGYDEVGSSGLTVAAKGTVDKVSRLRYIYKKGMENFKAFSMSDIIKTFKDGFFNAGEGKNFKPQNIKIRVFQQAEINQLNSDYPLKKGVPYLVIENPVQGDSHNAKTQFIELERRLLNKNDHSIFMDPIYSFVDKYNKLRNGLNVSIADLAEIINSTEDYLPTLLEQIKTKTGKDIILTNEQKELIKDINALLHSPLTEEQKKVFKNKKVRNIANPVMVDGKEVIGKVISVDNDIAVVKFGEEQMEVPVANLKVIANRRPGPAQAAFDEIARANQKSAGFDIRVKVRTKKGDIKRGKSLLPKMETTDPLNPTTAMSLEELLTIFTTDDQGNVSDLKVPVVRDGEFGGIRFDYTDGYQNNSVADNLLFLNKLERVEPTAASVTIDDHFETPPIAPNSDQAEEAKNETSRRKGKRLKLLAKDVKRSIGAARQKNDILKYLQGIDKTLTADEIKFVTEAELLKLSEGKEAWGLFKDGIIYLATDEFGKAYENVARHELFHRIFNMMLTEDQKQLVYKKAIEEYNLPENSDIIDIEEAIAEHYQEWRNGSKVKSFFQILFNKIRNFLNMSSTIVPSMDVFFKQIETGQFTDIVGFDDTTRNYKDILKDFGNTVNFRRSQLFIVSELSNLQDENATILQLENGKTAVDDGYLPKSTNEMFNAIYKIILEEYSELSKLKNLTEEDKEDLETLTILKNRKVFEDLIADMFENTKLSEIDDNTESQDILGSDWTDDINDAEQTNHETKLSSKVKQFLSTIINGDKQVTPRFAYLAALESLSNIDTTTKEILLKEIENRFNELKYTNNDVGSIRNAFNKLIDLAYQENNIGNTKIPEGYKFLNENSLEGPDGKKLHRGKQSTRQFFKSISEKTGLSTKEISALYIVNDAQNTFTELYAQIASLYKQDVYYGEYTGSKNNPSQSFKNAVVDSQIISYNNNLVNNILESLTKEVDGKPTIDWAKKTLAEIKRNKPFADNYNNYKAIFEKLFNYTAPAINNRFDFAHFAEQIGKIINDYEAYKEDSNKTLGEFLLTSSRGRFNYLSNVLIGEKSASRPASYRRADGKIAYLFTQASNAINIIQHFTEGHKKPKFLNTEFYGKNIFVSGINKIYKYVNFDAVKSDFTKQSVRYKNETEVNWIDRNFKYFFLASGAERKGRYIQQFLTISNKPNIVGAEINFLNWEQISDSIVDILNQQSSRNFSGVVVNNNLNIFENLLARPDNISNAEYAKQIVETIKAKGESLKTTLNLENSTDNLNLTKVTEYYAKSTEDLLSLYYANFYVNSHQLNQLVAGDQAFYKDSFDVIKRMSMAFATGYSGLVSKFSMNKTYKSLVLGDIEGVLGDDFLAFQKVWGKKFEFTDAQGYMTPKRAAEIRKGFGNAFKIGSVIKPVHFEIDSEGIPRGVKYSCIELTDELVDMFPKLKQLRDMLEDNDIDEAVFKSAVKVGKPLNVMESDADGNFGKLENGKYIIDPASVLTLQNSGYRIQSNPEHSVEDETSAFPTQLGYFFNFSGKNFELAEKLFEAQEELMNIGAAKLLSELGIRKRIQDDSREEDQKQQRQNLRKASAKKQSESKDQRQLEFLENSKLGINTPFLVKKVITDFASALTKATVAIRLPGAGLVLQSAYGTAEFTDKDGNLVQRDLKWRDADGFAEVILPDMWKDKFKEGDNIIFDTMVGFRIPSTELHSAIPLKVVGFYPGNKNVIIAPREIVFFHGSDYDVDKLYVMRKDAYSTKKSIITVNNEPLYAGGTIVSTDKAFYNKIQKDFTDTLNEIAKAKKLQDSVRVKELNKHLDILTELKEVYLKNVIVDSFLKVTTSKINEDLMMSPITMDRFKGMGIESEDSTFDMIAKLQGFKEAKPLLKDFATTDLYEDAVDNWIKERNKVIFGKRDLYDITDQMLMHKDNFSGTVLTGAFANMSKAIAYFFQSTTDGTYPTLEDNYHIELNGHIYSGFEYNEQAGEIPVTYDKDGKIVKSQPTITETIDSLVNAAIDNVKEQILPIIGFTNVTGGPAVALITMGISLNDVVRIMRQPVADLLNKETRYEKGRNAAKSIIMERLATLNKAPLTETQIKELEDTIEDTKITTKDLDSMFGKSVDAMSKEELIKQLAILKNIIGKANSISDTIGTGSTAYGVLKKFPVEFPKMQDVLEAFDKMWDSNTNAPNKGFIFTNVNPIVLPHINKAFKLLQTLKSNIENLFFVNNKALQEFASKVLTSVFENQDEDVKSKVINDFAVKGNLNENQNVVRENIIHYLMTGLSYTTPEGYEMTNSTLNEEVYVDGKGKERYGIDAFNYRFRENIQALKKANPGNLFLQNVTFNQKGLLVFTAARNIDQADLINFQLDFLKLKENNEFTKLQYDFVKYAIVNQGLSFGVNNYSLILPSEIYEPMMNAFNKYFEKLTGNPEEFKNLLNKVELNFKLQYALNTGESTVPYVNKDRYIEKDGGIKVKSDSDRPASLFIRTSNGSLYVLTSPAIGIEFDYSYVGNLKSENSYQFDTNILTGTYDLMKAFNVKNPVIRVANNEKNTFRSQKSFNVGQKVNLVNYSDPTRLKMIEAEIETAEKNDKGTYDYTVKNPIFVSSLMSDVDIVNSEEYKKLINSGVIHEEAIHKIKNNC